MEPAAIRPLDIWNLTIIGVSLVLEVTLATILIIEYLT
jgi:hypothetical protein